MSDDYAVVRDAVSRYGMRQLHLISNKEINVEAVMDRWLGRGEAEVALVYEEIGMWHLKLYWRVDHEMNHEKHEIHEIHDDHETHKIHEKGVLGMQEEGNG